MLRECDLNEISDGKRYGLNDMAKVGCDDCKGCSACCKGMGSSIVLDPLDAMRIEEALDLSFEELLVNHLELNVVDGIILPNLKMSGQDEACVFLNEEGRCSIHPARPSICRIFPLGRIYEDGAFSYFLQVNECKKTNRTKCKVSKWIDTPNLRENQKYVAEWHFFLKEYQDRIRAGASQEYAKQISMMILNAFFLTPFTEPSDFYEECKKRMELMRAEIK